MPASYSRCMPLIVGPAAAPPAHCTLQVHKAQLRRFRPDQLRHLSRREGGLSSSLVVQPGDTAWDICNSHGISLTELAASNRCAGCVVLAPPSVRAGVCLHVHVAH